MTELNFTPFQPPPLESKSDSLFGRRGKLASRVLSFLNTDQPAETDLSDVHDVASDQRSPVDVYKERWTDQVRRAVDTGWLDASVLLRLRDMYKLTIDVCSPQDMTGESVVGTYQNGHIQVTEGFVELSLIHELNHALAAGRKVHELSDGTTVELANFAAPWINESLTEHISEAMTGKDFGQIDTSSGEYILERMLLKELLIRLTDSDMGDKDQSYFGITIKDLTLRYSVPGESSTSPEMDAFTDMTMGIQRMIDSGVAGLDPDDDTDNLQETLRWMEMIRFVAVLRDNPQESIRSILERELAFA